MKFDWTEYLNLARNLIESDVNEAKQRACISRAYYAAFCVARNYLRDYLNDMDLKQSKKNNFNVHQHVTERFSDYDRKNQKMKQIGENLKRLRLLRNKADYDDVVSNLSSASKLSINLSQNIIDNIQSIIDEKDKTD